MKFRNHLDKLLASRAIPFEIHMIFVRLYESYQEVLRANGVDIFDCDSVFITFIDRVSEQVKAPFVFEPYHKKVTSPFNYYKFGIEFFRPLIDEKASFILKQENIDSMVAQLKKGENVILFANHQTEVDPQLLSIALEQNYHDFVSEMIFVAGDRVLTDRLAIPFSMGRNLLCIYSKRYIDNPPEKKVEKQHHNQKVMRLMSKLFAEGGKCVFVAPSGGRDRPNSEGAVEVSDFDAHSIEMFRLMSKQGKRPVHFYPLALDTYMILPPPDTVQWELGEQRIAHRDGIRFSFGDEIDMDNFPGAAAKDRHAKRLARAEYILSLVRNDFNNIKKRKK